MSYKVNDREYSFNSNVNQDIKGRFVSKHISGCVTSVVEYILSTTCDSYENFEKAPFNYDDIENLYINNDDEIEKLQEELEELESEINENEECLEELEEEYDNDRTIDGIMEEIVEVRTKLECLNESMEDIKNEINDLINSNDECKEVYEWWQVDNYLCNKLKMRGEVVISHMNYWGRQTTGQAILLDEVISEICYNFEILEGQKFSWENK